MSLTTTGVASTRRALQTVVKELATKGVRSAVRSAGKVFQAAIEERAPVLDETTANSTALPPGSLRDDVRTKVVTNEDGGVFAIVGPGKDTAHVARFVEYGHRLVHGGTSKVLVTGKTKGEGQQIGTVPAHPYIRPGYEASIDEANAAFVEEARKQLERIR